MRNFNSDVQGFVKKHRTQKRLAVLSIILAATVLLSVIASLIEPAISATNLKETNETVSDAIMLVGKNNVLYTAGDTVADVIAKANDRYALGIASQFSVFLETDFKTTAADTEGRLAVGGKLDLSGYLYGAEGGDGYRIGLGHYVDSYASINLVDSQFGGTYAHAIIGGTVGKKLATTPSVKETYEANDNTKTTRQRYFLVNADSNVDSSYDKTAFYTKTSDVLDFDSAFLLLQQRSGTISVNAKKATTTVTIDEANNKVTFTGPGEDIVADSIMFNVTAEQWAKISKMSSPQFIFTGIPKLATALTGTEVWGNDDCNTANCYATHNAETKNVTWENTYIIINVEGSGDLQMPQWAVQTSVNGYWINKGTKNDGETYKNLNNKFGCSTLLYNFSEATGLKLGGDFQGSILAPLADVTDMSTGGATNDEKSCKGHLSGALVAKSFDGATEFGYRSYTGPLEVLGTTTHYCINVDKLDGEGAFLEGAQLGLYTVDDKGNLSAEPVYEWTSGSATETIEVDAGTKYAVKEISAPTGYIKSDEIHYFTVTEAEKQQVNASYTETVTTVIPGTTKISKIALSTKEGPKVEGLTITITDGDGNTTTYTGANHILSGSGSSAQVNLTETTINGTKVYTMNSFTAIDAVSVTVTSTKGQNDSVTVYLYGENDTLLATMTDVNNNNTGSWQSTAQGGTVTEDVTKMLTFTYVPSVTLTTYNDKNFTQTKSQTTISTADLNNTSYEIGTEIISGTEAQTRASELGVNIASSGNNYFVIQNGMPLTPIVDTGKLTVVNTKEITQEGTDFTILAYDKDTGSSLWNSNYVLYSNDGTTVSRDNEYCWLNQSVAGQVKNEYKTDDGKLKPGTYYFVQNQSPSSDYVVPNNSTRLEFTVNSDGTITVSNNSGEYIEYDESTSTLKVYYSKTAEDPDEGETQVGADITILAYDKDTGSSLWNSNYVLYSNDGTTVSRDNEYCWLNQSVAGQVKNEYKTDDGKLKPGTYYFVQNKSPSSDYVVPNNSTRLEFTVNSDGTITVSNNSGEYIEYDESTSTLKVYYSKTAEDPDEGETQVGADITLQKVDKFDGTALSGATIALYNASDNTKIYEFSQLGSVNISGYIPNHYKLDGKLKPGTYYLIETAAPSGYTLPTGVKMYFTIATDGTVTVDSGSESYLIYESPTLKILNTKESSGETPDPDPKPDPDPEKETITIEKVWKDKNGNVISAPEGIDKITVQVTEKTESGSSGSDSGSGESSDSTNGSGGANGSGGSSGSSDSSQNGSGSSSTGSNWYTIENILSNYIIFVEDDFTSPSHMVGAIAAGGDFSVGSWGEGQIAPSIIGGQYIKGTFNPGDWLTEEQKATASDKVYYNTSAIDVSSNPNFIQDSDYLDFATAMQIVQKESEAIANGGLVITMDDITETSEWYGTQYTIDLSSLSSKNIVIPYSIFSTAGAINFTGVTLDDFATGGYKISITGVNDTAFAMSFTSYGSNGTKILLNNSGLDNQFKNLSGTTQGGQLNLVDGMNLMFNFPDATSTVTLNYLSGHIVAPGADVSITGGNFEGSVIAKSATTEGEGHFYSYKPFDEIDIYDPDTDYGDGTVPDEIPESYEVVVSKDNNWKVELELDPDKEYEFVEIDVPDGFVSEVQEGENTVTITNTDISVTAVMPSTGGSGTTIYFAAGAMLIAVACIGLVVKRRMVRRY